jgi:hypothetical protein
VADVATGAYKRLSEPTKFVGPKDIQERGHLSMEWAPVRSRKGDTVFFCARYGDDPEDGLIYRVEAGGESKPLRVTAGRCLGTTPDDLGIYVYRRAEQLGRVCLIPLDGKQRERELLSMPAACLPSVSPSGKWVAYHDGMSAIVIRSLQGAPLEMTIPGLGHTPALTRATGSFFWVNGPPPSANDLRR